MKFVSTVKHARDVMGWLTAVLFEQTFADTVASLVDAFVTRARATPP